MAKSEKAVLAYGVEADKAGNLVKSLVFTGRNTQEPLTNDAFDKKKVLVNGKAVKPMDDVVITKEGTKLSVNGEEYTVVYEK